MPTGYRSPPTDEQLAQMEKESNVKRLRAQREYQQQERELEFEIPGNTPHPEKLTELNETLLSAQALGANARRESLAALSGQSTDAPIVTTMDKLDPESRRQVMEQLEQPKPRLVGRPLDKEANNKAKGYALMRTLGAKYKAQAEKDRYAALQELAADILCGGDIFVKSGLMDCAKSYHTFAEIVSLVPQKGRDEGAESESTVDAIRKMVQGDEEE